MGPLPCENRRTFSMVLARFFGYMTFHGCIFSDSWYLGLKTIFMHMVVKTNCYSRTRGIEGPLPKLAEVTQLSSLWHNSPRVSDHNTHRPTNRLANLAVIFPYFLRRTPVMHYSIATRLMTRSTSRRTRHLKLQANDDMT